MQAVHRDLAPKGTLRAAINFGNDVVARREAASGEPRERAVDLANERARRLAVPCPLLAFVGVTGIVEAGAACRARQSPAGAEPSSSRGAARSTAA